MSPPRARGLALAWLQYKAVIMKEVRQTLQDKRVLALLTVAPFVQLLMFGFAINFDVDRVPTVVVDHAETAESRALVAGLLADQTLTRVATLESEAEADRWLESGHAAVALVVPADLPRSLARGEPAQVQVLLDGSDPTRSGVAGGAAGGYFGEVGLELARERLAQRSVQQQGQQQGQQQTQQQGQQQSGSGQGEGGGDAGGSAQAASMLPRALPGVEVRPRLLFNPTLSSAIYMVPGIAGMLLLIITTIVNAMGLARERELGTLEQVRVTPLPTWVLMLGKVTPFILIGLFDVTAAITAGAWLFGVPLRGSLLAFYGVTALYLMTTVGAGLYISTVSETQQQAFIGGFVVILPAMLLSGTLTPIHAMPSWLQPITWVNPLRFYLEAVRAILLKGLGVGDLLLQVGVLAAFGVLIVGAASVRFRKRVG